MYYLRRITPAKICVEDEEVPINILLENCTNKNTIDYIQASELGLPVEKHLITRYKDGSVKIGHVVSVCLKVAVTNVEWKTIHIKATLAKHTGDHRAKIKIGRNAIKELMAYIIYDQ